MNQTNPIIFIGGGITGLSTAWEIEQGSGYTLLEAGSCCGGKIASRNVPSPGGGRFILDGGAESILTRKPAAWDLAQQARLSDRIRDSGSETRDMYFPR